jgi:hypothetical protein
MSIAYVGARWQVSDGHEVRTNVKAVNCYVSADNRAGVERAWVLVVCIFGDNRNGAAEGVYASRNSVEIGQEIAANRID